MATKAKYQHQRVMDCLYPLTFDKGFCVKQEWVAAGFLTKRFRQHGTARTQWIVALWYIGMVSVWQPRSSLAWLLALLGP
jgi:hypothetical protein